MSSNSNIRQTCVSVSKLIIFCVTPIGPENFMIVSSINVLVSLFLKVGGFGGRSCRTRWSAVLDGHVGLKCLDADGHPRGHAKITPSSFQRFQRLVETPTTTNPEAKPSHSRTSSPIFTDLHSKQTELFLTF